MPNLDALRITLNQTKDEINNKQQLAAKLRTSAETHRQNGDEVTALNEENSASRYETDIQNAEVNLAAILYQISSKENKVKELQEKLNKLDNDYQKERSALEDEMKRAA